MKVVQQVLREVMQQAQQAETDELMDWGSNGAPPSKAVRMASTVVATVPILCVYPFIQKFFTQGVMSAKISQIIFHRWRPKAACKKCSFGHCQNIYSRRV